MTLPRLLSNAVLCMSFPLSDGLRTVPIRNGDTKAIHSTGTLYTQKTRLIMRQCHHALRHVPISIVTIIAL